MANIRSVLYIISRIGNNINLYIYSQFKLKNFYAMKHLLLFAFLISFHVSNSQTYYWSDLFGGNGFDFSNLVAIDNEGNVYNSGFYREGNFQIGDSVLPFVDNMDSYFVKFSPTGKMLWVIPLYGTGVFDRTEALCIDVNSDIYLLSTIQEEYHIGDQEFITIPEENGIDFLLMKFSPEGELYWYKTFEGPGSDVAYNMILKETEIILVGHYNDTLYMDDIELHANSQDMMIASLDMNGNVNWAKGFGGSGLDRLNAVDVFPDGSLAVCGYSHGDFQFGDSQLGSVSGVMYHNFIGRLDASGNPVWGVMPMNDFRTQAWDITTDGSGNSYICYTDQYYLEFKIEKYHSDGEISWRYSSENSMDTLTARATNVHYANGKLFVSGYISKGNILFGNQYDEIENTDYLLAVVHPEDGSLDTLFHDGGAGKLKTNGLFVDAINKDVALSILANGQVTVDGSDEGIANDDILLVKMDISDFIVSTEEKTVEKDEITVYPNPVSDMLFFDDTDGRDFDKVTIYDQLGKQIAIIKYNKSISVNQLKPGYYMVRLTSKGNPVTLRFVKK